MAISAMSRATTALIRVSPVDYRERRSKNGAMNDKQLKEFGQRVRRRREALNFTRLALSQAAGISRMTLRQLESGVSHPKQETLDKLVAALGVSEEALTGAIAIRPDDPLLEHLNEEDLQVAQWFHHAPTRVKQRLLDVLHDHTEDPDLRQLQSTWARIPRAERAKALIMMKDLLDHTFAESPADVTGSTVADPRRRDKRR